MLTGSVTQEQAQKIQQIFQYAEQRKAARGMYVTYMYSVRCTDWFDMCLIELVGHTDWPLHLIIDNKGMQIDDSI